jgi:hypothetical protein
MSKYKALFKKYPGVAYDMVLAVLTAQQKQTLAAAFDAAADKQAWVDARNALIRWGKPYDGAEVRSISDKIGDRAEFEARMRQREQAAEE